MSMKNLLSVVCLGLAIATGTAQASVVKTLVLAGESNGSISQTELNNIITGDARFDAVNSAAFDFYFSGNPSLSYLSQFNSILFSQDRSASTALLDRLADYVDGGGHLVMATFNGSYQSAGATGRIYSTGYLPVAGPTTDAYTSASLGSYDASNPIMAGVTTLFAGNYRGDYTGVAAGATLVASWDDGRPLVAVNAAGNVTYVSLFPAGQLYGATYTGDYNRLFANALAENTLPVNSVPEPMTIVSAAFGGVVALAFARLRRRAKE